MKRDSNKTASGETGAVQFPRFIEVQNALEKDPKNKKLKHEFKWLHKLADFLKKENERKVRHEVRRQARRAAQPTRPQTDDDEGQS